MKQVFILFLMFFLLGPFSAAAAPAGDSKGLAILFTGSVRGVLDPIHT